MKEKQKPQRAQRKPLCSQKEFLLKDITKQIISCTIDVYSSLGPGLLENVFKKALAQEFSLRGIEYERQKSINLIENTEGGSE